ncbi:AMP-dependent synthetase/ligase [Mycolicibacterium senegalense]|uniref:AMP-dependent synthetase/ligase n=1 Tax=Mycolicibacterium TaxID=1866885 RepID=UPI0032046D2F
MTTNADHRPHTLCEAFERTACHSPDGIALRTLDDTVQITWRQYRERVRAIAAGLAGLGVGRGDTVGLMLTNRPEFHLCDTAVLHLGATPFSVYNTNPPDTLRYLFDNADNRVVICERQFLPAVLAAQTGSNVEHVVCVDGPAAGALSLADLEVSPAPGFDFDNTWRAVQPDDVLTIVYTSGTTGPPKGVELTHTNFIENARIAEELGGISHADRAVSYLPDAHAANRWITHYQSLLSGLEITTVSDTKQIVQALNKVRPTVFLGVPRIWIKVKAALEASIAEETGAKKALAHWAFSVGTAMARTRSAGTRPTFDLRVRFALADRLVLSAIRKKLGFDKIRLAVTGAAPIPLDVHEFILGLGVDLCEGYGMTECTAAAAVSRPSRIKIGTVGLPVPGVQVRIADDGEVLVRGKNVMRGYRKDPDKTREAIDSDGWLHTGDIGRFDEDGFLRIVDRKKEIIINAAGKNMSPTNIENAIASNTPLAGPVAVIGDARPYNTALITLDADAAGKLDARRPIAELATDPRVREAIEAGIAAANRRLSRVEQIKKFTILGDTWDPGSPHLTPTGKLKRKAIHATYADVIEGMYGTAAAPSPSRAQS